MAGSYEVARIEAIISANNAKFETVIKQSEKTGARFAKTTEQNFKKADAAGASLGGGVRKAEAEFAKLTGTAARAGRAIATSFGIGAAIGIPALGAAILTTGTNFDKTMSMVQAATGATTSQFQTLRKAAIDLGGSTIFSASEVGASMVALGKAGFKTEQQLSALPGVLDAAAASGEDMASVSTVIVDTLGGFGLAAGNATHLADALAHVANATTDDIGGLGEALKYVAPVAKDAGLSLDETAASLQVLAKGGIKGSMAGTSLRGVLMSLQAPNIRVTNAMGELGLSFRDANGNMLPMADMIDTLKQRLGGLEKSQADKFLARMFGRENITAAKLLLDTGGKGFQRLTREIRGSNGEAKKFASVMTDNLAGDVEQLKGALESAAISLSDEFRPQLRDSVKELQAWVQTDDFKQTAHDIAGGVASVADAFAGATKFIWDHRGAIAALTASYVGFKAAASVGTIVQGFTGIAAGSTQAASGIGKFTGLLNVSKLGVYGLGVGAIAGAYTLYKVKQSQAAAEERKSHSQTMQIVGGVIARRDAAAKLAGANDALKSAVNRTRDAEDKFGEKSPQHVAALEAQRAAAKRAADAQRDLNKAVEDAPKNGKGDKVDPKSGMTNKEESKTNLELISTNEKLAAAIQKRADAMDAVLRAEGKMPQANAAMGAKSPATIVKEQEAAQVKLNEAYRNGTVSQGEYASKMSTINGLISDNSNLIKDARDKYESADKKVQGLKSTQKSLWDAMGISSKQGVQSMTTTFGSAFNRIVGGSNKVRSELMKMAHGPLNPTAAKQLLSNMGTAERYAKFGTANINEILSQAGLAEPNPKWKKGITSDFATATGAARSAKGQINSAASSALSVKPSGTWISGFLSDLERARTAASRPIQGPGIRPGSGRPGPSANGHASGGMIHGPGTGTSDSVPIWASNGEFVMKAAAVDKYGDGFMEAVNAGKFAKGGKVGKGKQHEKTDNQWSKVRDRAGFRSTDVDLRLAKAELTTRKTDDISAYQAIIATAMRNRTSFQQFLNKNKKRMSGSTRADITGSIASELRTVLSARESIKSLREEMRPAKNTGTGVGENQSAQIAQLQARLARAEDASRINANAVNAFGGSGDIGFGGAHNAYGGASGNAPTIVIQSLTGYDPRIEKTVTKVMNRGNATGGNADRLYTGRRTIAA